MAGKLITEFTGASSSSIGPTNSLLVAVGDPSTGNLYKARVDEISRPSLQRVLDSGPRLTRDSSIESLYGLTISASNINLIADEDNGGIVNVTSIKTTNLNSSPSTEWRFGTASNGGNHLGNLTAISEFYATIQINGVDWYIPIYAASHIE